MTGVFFHHDAPDQPFDAFCFHASDLSVKNCDLAINPDSTGPESVQVTDGDLASDAAGEATEQSKTVEVPEEKTDIQTYAPAVVEDQDQVQPETTEGTPEDRAQPEDRTSTEPDTVDTTSAPEKQGAESPTEVVEKVDPTQPASTEASPEEPTSGAEGEASEGAATESPDREEEQTEGDETQSAGHTGVLATEMEDTTGSGMLPTVTEEGASSIAPPVGQPGEPQGSASEENVQEEEEGGGVPDQPIPRGRMNPGEGVAPTPAGQENSSTPDWLVIVGVVVAVGAILLVCAAVAKRKSWCGQQQTLMITNKDGSDGNGAAVSVASSRAQEREQEMVTLMNKEKIQENCNTEEFTVITLDESPEKGQLA
ncbi:uncharacterized protein KIAA0754 [Salmo trutta]|uniref:uncharacterized protein KIAA0754 n=1 Tax=Salmo trutta TaxID=8032 RepID=UPI0011301F19|nr:uncharacterized protein KIAA0754-like [Salmo trutta]